MLLFSKIFRIPLRSGVEVEQFIVSILLTPSKYIRRSSLSKETNTNKVNAVVIEAAKKALYTGHIGDGKIFVYDVAQVVKVRTGEEGIEALQDVE